MVVEPTRLASSSAARSARLAWNKRGRSQNVFHSALAISLLLAGYVASASGAPLSPDGGRAPANRPGLEGRWVLVEQGYGKGHTDLTDADRPLWLEVLRADGELAARIQHGDDAAGKRDWPAWVAGDEPLPATVRRRSLDADRGVLEARYEVRPSAGDDVVLEVTESYRLVEDGTALVGSVEVKFVSGSTGEAKGSYILTRRFERQPREQPDARP